MNKLIYTFFLLTLWACQPIGKPVDETGTTNANNGANGDGSSGGTTNPPIDQFALLKRKLPQASTAKKIPQGYVSLGCSNPTLYNFCFSVIDHNGDKIGEFGDTPKLNLTGTNPYTVATSIAYMPPSDVIIVGHTTGNLAEPQGGNGDGFVARYTLSGTRVWMKQWGAATGGASAAERDDFLDVAIDASKNIFIAGRTRGNLFAQNAGNFDAFWIKLSSAGALSFSKQVIGAGATNNDEYKNISINANGQVLLSGTTCGNLFETNGAPTTDTGYSALAPCPTEKFSDVIASLYNGSGALLFNRQIGKTTLGTTSGKGAHSDFILNHTSNVAGEIFLTGGTSSQYSVSSVAAQNSELNGGLIDLYVAKLNASGALQWIDQIGSINANSNKIDIGEKLFYQEETSTLLVCGTTTGNLLEAQGGGTGSNHGKGDIVLLTYSNVGAILGSRHVGNSIGSRSTGRELCGSIIRDNDTIALFGMTDGSLYPEAGSAFMSRDDIGAFLTILD